MHVKRNKMPKTWPVERKGTKYIAKPSHNLKAGIPVLFVLRDVLGLVKTRKEAKYAMTHGEIKINNIIRKDEAFPVGIFDVLSLDKIKKHYKITIVKGKFALEEVSEKDSKKKVAKIVGKKIINPKSVQMNLEGGLNILVKEKFSPGDSVLLNTEKNSVEKVLPLKEGANVEVIGGKHSGEKGVLKEITQLKREKSYSVKLEKKIVQLPLKTLMVIE